MISRTQIQELRKTAKGHVLTAQSMGEYTSLRVGGPADVIVFPEDTEDLENIIEYLNHESLDYFILGNGTNLLVKDDGINEVVISLARGFKRVESLEEGDSPMVFAEAGVQLAGLVKFTMDRGLSGLEFASGIPGTVGGGLSMNAGGNLGEMKDITLSMTLMDQKGRMVPKKKEDLEFSYRSLQLPPGSIILNAVFQLKLDAKAHIRERVKDSLSARRSKQPLDFPNAGSIFKNPEGIPAGKLIEESGLKGFQIGDAQVSERHANFIINLGNATASDVQALMEEIQTRVYAKTGMKLEPEIRIIGRN